MSQSAMNIAKIVQAGVFAGLLAFAASCSTHRWRTDARPQ